MAGENNFFSYISRMKNINRWGLMRNTRYESLSEHSFETAVIAHALALIYNRESKDKVNAEKIAVMALYHDASEIITGDMPTPVKYSSEEMKNIYKGVEREAKNTLISKLPEELKEEYLNVFSPVGTEKSIIKAADKLSAIIKCIEEINMGNHDFDVAYTTLLESVKDMDFTPADIFVEEFLPGYYLTLDEQK